MVINHQNRADSRKVSLIAALPLRFRSGSHFAKTHASTRWDEMGWSNGSEKNPSLFHIGVPCVIWWYYYGEGIPMWKIKVLTFDSCRSW